MSLSSIIFEWSAKAEKTSGVKANLCQFLCWSTLNWNEAFKLDNAECHRGIIADFSQDLKPGRPVETFVCKPKLNVEIFKECWGLCMRCKVLLSQTASSPEMCWPLIQWNYVPILHPCAYSVQLPASLWPKSYPVKGSTRYIEFCGPDFEFNQDSPEFCASQSCNPLFSLFLRICAVFLSCCSLQITP